MPLDPQAQMLLEQLAMMEELYETPLDVAEIRRRSDASSVSIGNLKSATHIENLVLDGPGGPLPVRLYTPQGHGPFPILVYFHGGGWIAGNLDMADPLCHSLANIAQCIVIGVQYRLAPEHKFPAALEDAFAAIRWAASNAERFNGDPERLAVGGDSAGGNLAAAVAHMARDQHGPALMYQMLLYPSTDHNAFLDTTRQGFEYIMNPLARIRFHSECYLNNWEEATNPLASPLLAPNFADLPPSLVVTTEYDYLHEQGKRYAERLQDAGVPVTYKHYDGMMHGFISMAAFLDQGQRAITEIGTILYHTFYPTA